MQFYALQGYIWALFCQEYIIESDIASELC